MESRLRRRACTTRGPTGDSTTSITPEVGSPNVGAWPPLFSFLEMRTASSAVLARCSAAALPRPLRPLSGPLFPGGTMDVDDALGCGNEGSCGDQRDADHQETRDRAKGEDQDAPRAFEEPDFATEAEPFGAGAGV